MYFSLCNFTDFSVLASSASDSTTLLPKHWQMKVSVLPLQKDVSHMTEKPKFHRKHCLNSHSVVAARLLRKPQSCAHYTRKKGCKWQWLHRTRPFLLECWLCAIERKISIEDVRGGGAANNVTLEFSLSEKS